VTQLAEISAALRAAVFTIFLPGLRFNSLSTELITASNRSELGAVILLITRPRSFQSRAPLTRDELSSGGGIEREFFGQCD
jgi:hypothetical protein